MAKYSKSDDLCISCLHIVRDKQAVLSVSRPGGDWIFLCSSDHHYEDDNTDKLVTIHWQHLLDNDQSLSEIQKMLLIDYTADRKYLGDDWKIYYDPDEKDDS